MDRPAQAPAAPPEILAGLVDEIVWGAVAMRLAEMTPEKYPATRRALLTAIDTFGAEVSAHLEHQGGNHASH